MFLIGRIRQISRAKNARQEIPWIRRDALDKEE